jgi:hypothetical protein
MAVKKKSTVTDKAKATATKTRDKPPPLDLYLKPIVGVVLALLGYQFMKGMTQQEILRVNLEDQLELREVLFGEDVGGNYAVLCHPESATYPLSSVFQDAARDGTAPATFRVVDCDTVIPNSEKQQSIKDRFKLNDKTRPMIFVSGKAGPPKQVKPKNQTHVWVVVVLSRDLFVLRLCLYPLLFL